MASSSILDDRFRQASASPGTSNGVAAAGAHGWVDDAEARVARLAAWAWRLARTGAPALTFIYLGLIWAVFAVVLLATPHPAKGLGAHVLTGLAGL